MAQKTEEIAHQEDERAHQEDDVTSEAARTNGDGQRKLEMWGQIRPTLWPVEQALRSRYKKIKKTHSAGLKTSSVAASSELVSPKEAASSPTKNPIVVSEDESEEFYDMERSDVNDGVHNANAMPDGLGVATNANTDEQGEEEPCPWKEELDALVQGGVPMALRGEVIHF